MHVVAAHDGRDHESQVAEAVLERPVVEAETLAQDARVGIPVDHEEVYVGPVGHRGNVGANGDRLGELSKQHAVSELPPRAQLLEGDIGGQPGGQQSAHDAKKAGEPIQPGRPVQQPPHNEDGENQPPGNQH